MLEGNEELPFDDHMPTYSLANSANIDPAYSDEEELESRILEEHVKSVEELPLEVEGERENEAVDRLESVEDQTDSDDESHHTKSSKHSKAASRAASKNPSRATSRAASRTPSRAPSRPPSRPASRSPPRRSSRAPSRTSSRSPPRPSSRAPSRPTSRSPSRPSSRAPSRPSSRSASRGSVDLFDIVGGEEYATEEKYAPESEDENGEDRDGDRDKHRDSDRWDKNDRDDREGHSHRNSDRWDRDDREREREREKQEINDDHNPVELVRVRSHGTGTEMVKVKSHASAIVEFFNDPVERESWRKIIHKTLEDPLYSRTATVFAVFMNLIVLLSVAIVIAYPPNYSPHAPRRALDKLEIFVSVVSVKSACATLRLFFFLFLAFYF